MLLFLVNMVWIIIVEGYGVSELMIVIIVMMVMMMLSMIFVWCYGVCVCFGWVDVVDCVWLFMGFFLGNSVLVFWGGVVNVVLGLFVRCVFRWLGML